jgi:DNA-binding protein
VKVLNSFFNFWTNQKVDKMKRKNFEDDGSGDGGFSKKMKPSFQFENQMIQLENENDIKTVLKFFLEFKFETFSEIELEALERKIVKLLNHKNEHIQMLSLKLLGKIYAKNVTNFEILIQKLKSNLKVETIEILIDLIQTKQKEPSNTEKLQILKILNETLLDWNQHMRKRSIELMSYLTVDHESMDVSNILLNL